MEKTFQLSGAVILALAIAGCGSSSSSSGDPITVVSAKGASVEVGGTWTTDCLLFGEGTDNAFRAITEMDITVDKIAMTTMTFDADDATCSGPVGKPIENPAISYAANGAGKASWDSEPPAKGDGSGNWDAQVDVSLYSLSTGSTGSIFLDDTGESAILYTGDDDVDSADAVQVLSSILAFKAVK
ncbi:MAG: hypothetical protein HWE20_17090 [Gammaproteobacteria bacterium]|nr:hypothetical protein [Gammaproteobacteria bacterium]